jgi:hypothetical protein
MDFYEELKFMQGKMTLKEAAELQRDMASSELDVEIELNELKEEIAGAPILAEDLERFLKEVKHSSDVNLIRKELLDSPFAVCAMNQYEALLRKYYSLRCLEYGEPLSKKEYFRLLNHGGISSVELLNRTQPLFNAYKDIETAERETLSSKAKP